MKTFIYCLCLAGILLLASFAPADKGRKITLPMGNHVGHVQWVKVTPYQAIKDSIGSIIKGMPIGNAESWTYDEYGDEIENDQYYSQSNKHKKTYEYYPNGDIKEIIKDSSVRTSYFEHHHNLGICDHIQYTYTYKNFDIRYNNRYDASGNLLYSTECTYDSGSTSALSCNLTQCFYDSDGKMLERFTFTSDTVHPGASTLFRYDKMGQLAEEDKSEQTTRPGYDDNLAPTEKIVLKRNEKGSVIDEATYRFKVGLIKDKTTTFDNAGDTLETLETTYAGTAQYNSLRGTKERQFFKATGTLQEDVYDANGRLIDYSISHFDSERHLMDRGRFHITYYSPTIGDTLMVEHIINDEHFNVIEDDGYGNDGKVAYKNTWQYKYDSVGNWVEQVSLTNGNPGVITEREIHYFPRHN